MEELCHVSSSVEKYWQLTLALREAEPVMRLAMTRGRIISFSSLMKSSPG